MNDAAQARVNAVFERIGMAAAIIETSWPNECLEDWNRQEALMPFVDPTAYKEILAARDDMARKKAILQAAANFLNEWNRIKAEALAAAGATTGEGND